MTLLTLPLRIKTNTIHELQRCKERRGSPQDHLDFAQRLFVNKVKFPLFYRINRK